MTQFISNDHNISDAAQIKIVQLIAKELGVGPIRWPLPSRCSTRARPCPHRALSQEVPAISTTRTAHLEERLLYLRELKNGARDLASIEEQGKLTDELRGAIEAAATKQTLEDLYLPYSPSAGRVHRWLAEAGLEPLPMRCSPIPRSTRSRSGKVRERETAADGADAINIPDAKAALEGARDILVERFAETAELLARLRARMWEHGVVTSTVMKGKETAEEEKFRDYYAYASHTHHPSIGGWRCSA